MNYKTKRNFKNALKALCVTLIVIVIASGVVTDITYSATVWYVGLFSFIENYDLRVIFSLLTIGVPVGLVWLKLDTNIFNK